ncbi:hypothetical protein [Corynebacterium casei]|uniref:hypothetical protein n=1 Tax=Corynebacterium casei TaxID=160386 RepID=UPI00186832C2|nr:hypothetical protein [Corynebacterium casei]MDN5740710.1 hypothetical protein [Corynebacterium casei]MDN6415726.1 hypothetical protein [Corynebacterium casei]MDN6444163.1 hypothetical protein [Corynebacterium casei]MDN6629166.1 hypothetical protein [Corynebacterium casei]MDN6675124.1 hypothetical protein [Corynebacterium casei]
MSGAFATPFVLRSKEPVAKLPKALSDSVASVASYAGATVMAAVEAGGDLAGKRVLVVGMGMQGMITCDVAAQAGAKEVYAADPSPERRAWAKAIGGVTASVHLKDQSLEAASMTSSDSCELIPVSRWLSIHSILVSMP